MKIHDFSYFNPQQVADSKKSANNVTDQDFDLDIHTIVNQGSDPVVEGSGHFWCHFTDKCTGDVCSMIVCAQN